MTWHGVSRRKPEVERLPDRGHAGWEKLRVVCWHGKRAVARGIPSLIDQWQYEASALPCQFVDCPHAPRTQEDPP